MGDEDGLSYWPPGYCQYTLLLAKETSRVVSFKTPFDRILEILESDKQKKKNNRWKLECRTSPPFPKHMGDKLCKLSRRKKLRDQRVLQYELPEALNRPDREQKMTRQAVEARRRLENMLMQATLREKEEFEQQFKRKFAKGYNTYSWADGRSYDGQWQDGQPSGTGYMSWPDPSFKNGTMKYQGKFVDGLPHGPDGKKMWADGSTYLGQWAFGMENGIGKKVNADGSTYDGDWKDGYQYGRGIQTWPDGTVYEGEFKREETRSPYAVMIQCAFRRMLAVRVLNHYKKPRMNVPSLSSLCFKAVARGVMKRPKLFPPELLKRKLPKHMKALLASAFMEDVDGLSEKFKRAVPAIAWNDDIEELSFTEARPTAPDLDMMMFFCSSAEKLVRLNLTWNKYTLAGVECLAAFIKKNKTIKKLELSWNCFGPTIARPVVDSLFENDTVTLLDLAGNKLGVEGAELVRDMMKANQSITDLNMGFNEIGVPGTKAICYTIKTSITLVSLNLEWN